MFYEQAINLYPKDCMNINRKLIHILKKSSISERTANIILCTKNFFYHILLISLISLWYFTVGYAYYGINPLSGLDKSSKNPIFNNASQECKPDLMEVSETSSYVIQTILENSALAFQVIAGLVLALAASAICRQAPILLSAILALMSFFHQFETYYYNNKFERSSGSELIVAFLPEALVFFAILPIMFPAVLCNVLFHKNEKGSRLYRGKFMIFLLWSSLIIIVGFFGINTIVAITKNVNYIYILPGALFVCLFLMKIGLTAVARLLSRFDLFVNKDDFSGVEFVITDELWLECFMSIMATVSITYVAAPMHLDFDFNYFSRTPSCADCHCKLIRFIITLYFISTMIIFTKKTCSMKYAISVKARDFKEKVCDGIERYKNSSTLMCIQTIIWNIYLAMMPVNTALFFVLKNRYIQDTTAAMLTSFIDMKSYLELILYSTPILLLIYFLEYQHCWGYRLNIKNSQENSENSNNSSSV